jgi:predicted AAA+ superfamily ATPase
MPENIRYRIFEPCFTTKDVGKGTGGIIYNRAPNFNPAPNAIKKTFTYCIFSANICRRGILVFFKRAILPQIQKQLDRGKSILLLGPRQTGKTTLLENLKVDLTFDLLNISNKLKYEKNPQLLISEIEDFLENKKLKKNKPPIVFIDEIQKIPVLLDPIQSLIDKKRVQFILTGSSARKLRTQAQVNLLPGRVVLFQMYGFALGEVKSQKLEDHLMYGTLPSIYLNTDKDDKELDLKSYVEIYIEQEIRQEAVTRNLGAFARFLELAGVEAGQILNYTKIAQDIGVSVNTLKSYFEQEKRRNLV